MNEFELIHQVQQALAGPGLSAAGVELGIGDDAAVLAVPEGQHLVAATDTLNEGTHFPAGTPANDIAHKSLAVAPRRRTPTRTGREKNAGFSAARVRRRQQRPERKEGRAPPPS